MVTSPALRYFGAKWRLAKWIISHFPPHECYVEPFGGSGAVLLRKDSAPIEFYNDLDSEVVNFFRVLRTHGDELKRRLALTPYSREEFEAAYAECDDQVEKARRFFIRAWQGYAGPRSVQLTGWKSQKRLWQASRADQISEWTKARELDATIARLQRVQIECRDALHVIDKWDTPTTLFYLDPPYPATTRSKRWNNRSYSIEIPGHYHTHVANALRRIEGMAIISTYPNQLYDDLFQGWRKVERPSQTISKKVGVEVLYISPNCPTDA